MLIIFFEMKHNFYETLVSLQKKLGKVLKIFGKITRILFEEMLANFKNNRTNIFAVIFNFLF